MGSFDRFLPFTFVLLYILLSSQAILAAFIPMENNEPSCNQAGMFPYQSDCEKYYHCNLNEKATVGRCQPRTAYSSSRRLCVVKSLSDCAERL